MVICAVTSSDPPKTRVVRAGAEQMGGLGGTPRNAAIPDFGGPEAGPSPPRLDVLSRYVWNPWSNFLYSTVLACSRRPRRFWSPILE